MRCETRGEAAGGAALAAAAAAERRLLLIGCLRQQCAAAHAGTASSGSHVASIPLPCSPDARLHLAVWVAGLGGAAGDARQELARRPRLPGVGAELHQYAGYLLQLHAARCSCPLLCAAVGRGGRTMPACSRC